MAEISSELLSLYRKGKSDPVFFVENVIGASTLWEKQKEIAYSVRDNPRTAVRSCNGAGKTYTTANVVTWFLATHPNSIVISTAPTSRQVRELLWQEIRNLQGRSRYPLGGSLTLTSWTMGAKWFALGLSTDEPNRFQGFHAEHILGVIDEAAGVDAPIWEGMDAILTSSGARLLVIGNPTEPSGRFYDAFSSPLYNKLHISAFDTPNFTENGITMADIQSGEWKSKMKRLVYPALITPQWVADRLIEWGEESPAYQARVLGNFPIIGTDTMIPLGWVLRAKERACDNKPEDQCVIAVDVARFGDDESTIAVRRGNSLKRLEVINNADVHTLSKAVKRIADSEGYFKTSDDRRSDVLLVDAVGIGAGVADNLRAWGYRAIDFIAQGRAWEQDKFINRRTEAWYRAREKFRKNEINIPGDDEVLIGQLAAPKYKFDAAGRYQLESKEDMKKRGLASPDRADAVIMAFDFDGTLDVVDMPDYAKYQEIKPGTVGALIEMLGSGKEEEITWNF